jgi:hypothetical protein
MTEDNRYYIPHEVLPDIDSLAIFSTLLPATAKRIDDLYKVYVNPLLDILSNSGLGGKIGNINCCAPTYWHVPLRTSKADLSSNKPMYVGEFRSLFSLSYSSVNSSQSRGAEFSVKPRHIPDSLKIGTLFPVFKNKGDIKSAKNYRGITVTPTFSKIMEKIIKIRENPTLVFNCLTAFKSSSDDTSL